MEAIGGYFTLELHNGLEYHDKAIKLNTGRNALEYILTVRKYSKVFIPYYTCDTVLEPLDKLGLSYEFYSVNNMLEPEFDFKILNSNTAFLYTNYFGIKDKYIKKLTKYSENIIIDNAQAFFSEPIPGIDTLYSARKFFGVPDGAYLYTINNKFIELPYDQSLTRISHLIKRIENGPEAGYNDFKTNDNSLIGQPIKIMSKFTQSVLSNIDYKYVRKQRINNFSTLDNELSKLNKLSMKLGSNTVPMVYPLLMNKTGLKQKLIDNKIFVPTYWPNVLKWAEKGSTDYQLTENLIALPIDQRYSTIDMEIIIKIIKENIRP